MTASVLFNCFNETYLISFLVLFNSIIKSCVGFPAGCQYFSVGPAILRNPLECYNNIFLDSGCIREGEGYPQKLRTFEQNALQSLSLM